MSETPLPQTTAEAPSGDAEEARGARKRGDTKPGLPVSVPPPETAGGELDAGSELSPEDATFVAALRRGGLLQELADGEACKLAASVSNEEATAKRRLDFLLGYYDTETDPVAALRRKAADRWFMYRDDENLHAAQLVQRLLGVVPELLGATLERVGGSAGALVLRVGDDVCGLDDDYPTDAEGCFIGVHELVRGINVLLERKGVRTRLVGLLGDGQREAYLGMTSLTRTLSLNSADYLMAKDAEELINQTAW